MPARFGQVVGGVYVEEGAPGRVKLGHFRRRHRPHLHLGIKTNQPLFARGQGLGHRRQAGAAGIHSMQRLVAVRPLRHHHIHPRGQAEQMGQQGAVQKGHIAGHHQDVIAMGRLQRRLQAGQRPGSRSRIAGQGHTQVGIPGRVVRRNQHLIPQAINPRQDVFNQRPAG